MASKQTPSPDSVLRFPQWQGEYEAALRETDCKTLFKRVEIAEAALLNRQLALKHESDGRVERQEIETALDRLRAVKKDILNFQL
jgi:hypothetical protein